MGISKRLNSEKINNILMRYAAIIESSDDAIISKTLDGIVTSWNAGATKIFGYSEDEMVGQPISILIPEEFKNEESIFLTKIRHGETLQHYETVRRKKDGSLINVSVSLSPMLWSDEKIYGASKIVRDVTERIKKEKWLYESEKNFRFMLENSPIAIRIVNKESGQVVFANHKYADLIGVSIDEVIGINPRIFYDNSKEYDDIQESLSKGKPVIDRLIKFQFGREQKWSLSSFIPIEFRGESAILAWLHDISKQKALEEQEHELALHDPLTKLPNRRNFDERMKSELASIKRTGIYSALLFLDLDNFKYLNDTHGHLFGDLLLIAVAQRLVHCVREVDMVARLGGDEFVVLLTGLAQEKERSTVNARKIAKKIRDSLAKPHVLRVLNNDNKETFEACYCTTSIGVSIFGGSDISLENTLRIADEAMYKSKKNGGNSIN
jgi:diguanylate cyclase (GGDEF)-like protein/PAS domain S-box-containing protein